MALNPDQLFVLPWHFINTLRDKLDNYLIKGGRLVTPLPHVSMYYKEDEYNWILEQKASVF